MNRTILNIARANLSHSNLPPQYWEPAIRDAIFKYNFTIHSTIQSVPHTLWHNKDPLISQLFIFGQLGTIPNLQKLTKLEPRNTPVRYLYARDETHVILLDLRNNRSIVSRTIDFKPYCRRHDPVLNNNNVFKLSMDKIMYIPNTITNTTPAPFNMYVARKYPDANEWKDVHNTELKALEDKGVIQWIPDSEIPKNARPLPLTMSYAYKRDEKGNICKRKARCAIRGDLMLPSIHYNPNNTASYTADRTAVCCLYACSAALNLKMEHFDITAAYLHEDFRHCTPIYVKRYPNFDGSFIQPTTTGILKKNFWGTKQAGNIYYQGLEEFLKQHEYEPTKTDPCLFIKASNHDFTIVALTVDDFIVSSTKSTLITDLYNTLTLKYNIKRLGLPTNYLNWHITHNEEGIHISQPHVIDKILTKLNLNNANSSPTPYCDGLRLDPAEQNEDEYSDVANLYREIIGELRYLVDSTRFDICYVVGMLAKSNGHPTKRHWRHLKRLCRYLKGTKHHGILYKRGTGSIVQLAYGDADFANCTKTRKSVSGSVHTLNDSPIYWTSKQQTVVSLSTCEAEFIAASETARQCNWIHTLLTEIKFKAPSTIPTLFTDNQAAHQVAHNRASSKCRKYIDIRFKHCRALT